MSNRKQDSPGTTGRYAYDGLDRLLHEKARLGILASLLAHVEGLRFNELKELCSLTDGNLSRHLQVLREASLIEIWKGFEHKRPQTLCRLSTEGRARFLDYLAALEQVLRDAAQDSVRHDGKRRPSAAPAAELPGGWVPA